MGKDKSLEFERAPRAEDEILSSHSELIRSHDYSNEEMYPMDSLRRLAEYWEEESENPIRSERSKNVCKLIAAMAHFELAYRNGRVQVLIDFYGGQDGS